MPIAAPDLARIAIHSISDYVRNQSTDQIGYKMPFYAKLMEGRKNLMPGLSLKESIVTAYDTNFAWSKGPSARTFTKRTPMQQTDWAWSTMIDGIKMDWDELFAAGVSVVPGEAAHGKIKPTTNEKVILFNYLEAQTMAFLKGFKERANIELHRNGAQSTDAIAGLDAIVSATPSVGVVGGVNAATTASWRNYYVGSVATINLRATMDVAWRKCHRNGQPPNYIKMGSTALDAYASTVSVVQNADASKVKKIDAGIGSGTDTGLWFKGVPVVWDPTHEVLDALEAPIASMLWEKRIYMMSMGTDGIAYEDDEMQVYNPATPIAERTSYTSLDLRVRMKTKRRSGNALIIVA
jgi:hypothetical protein